MAENHVQGTSFPEVNGLLITAVREAAKQRKPVPLSINHVPRKILTQLDPAGVHKTKAVTVFIAIESQLSLRHLSPYAAKLNPTSLV